MSDRYEGKPFLRMLDSYILDAIGQLPEDQAAALVAMEPQFQALFGRTGDWRTVVAEEMRFPEGMAGAVREVWDKGRVRFQQANGHDPDPVEFTRHFVDTNFPR